MRRLLGQAGKFGDGGRGTVLTPLAGIGVDLVVVDALAQHGLGEDEDGVVHDVTEPPQPAVDLGAVRAVDEVSELPTVRLLLAIGLTF